SSPRCCEQPDRRRAEHYREDKQPAGLDELHRPEPADRDVAPPVGVAGGPGLEYPRGAWRAWAAEQLRVRGADRHGVVLAQHQPGQLAQQSNFEATSSATLIE